MIRADGMHRGRPPERTAAALRKLLKRAGVPKIDKASLRVLEEAGRSAALRVEPDPYLVCFYDEPSGRERAHFVRVETAIWAAMIEGVETVRGTLSEVVEAALAPRPAITAAARKKIVAWSESLYPNDDVELYLDATQISVERGPRLLSFAPTRDRWILVADDVETRGSLDEVLAAGEALWDARTLHEAAAADAAAAAWRLAHPPKPPIETNESGAEDANHRLPFPAWCPGVVVAARVRIERGRSDVSPAQRAAMEYFEAHGEEIGDAARRAVFKMYERDSSFVEEQGLTLLSSPKRMHEQASLQSAIVHASSDLGVAYIGLVFDCAWEEEHGVGLLLHRKRVVSTGYADTATQAWIGAEDAVKRAARRAKASR